MYENIIFIPYREREQHLKYFIENTVPLIQCNLPNTRVVVIEQNEGKLFNRGAILNVGFKEYENKSKYFITHDVDTIPNLEIIKNTYNKEDIDILCIKFTHIYSLGNIIKVKHDIIFNMNGFPNNIWGWGVEDRALHFRSYIKKINIQYNNNQSFKILQHKSNIEPYIDEKKKISDIWRKEYIDNLNDKEKEEMIMSSGLNNIEYKIIERKMIHDIVELIKVDI